MRRIWVTCLCAAVLAALPGCGSGPSGLVSGTSTDGATSTGGSSPTTEAFSTTNTSPPPETGGTEAPRTDQSSKPAIEVAGLPIGVNSDGYCVDVRLLRSASEVPPGMRLVVTGVSVDPFGVGGDGCSGQSGAPCLGLALTESSTDECVVPVTPPPGTPSADGVPVTVAASVDCPSGQDAACRAFRDRLDVDAKDQSATTDISPPDTSTTDTSTTDTST